MIYGINHCLWPPLSGRIFNGVNLVYQNDENSDTGRKPVRSYDPAWTSGEIETLARRGVNIAQLGQRVRSRFLFGRRVALPGKRCTQPMSISEIRRRTVLDSHRGAIQF